MIAAGWFRFRVVPLQKTCSLNFKFLLFFFGIVLDFAPAGEKASLQSIECSSKVDSFDDFENVCESDHNSHDRYRKCTEAYGKSHECRKCSLDYHSPKCTTTVVIQGLVCINICYNIIRRSVRTLLLCKTCLPNGKSQTGRYHQEENDIEFRLFLGSLSV